jgi:hypothetical protein
VLGLPEATALDTRTRVKRVNDAPADDVRGARRSRDEKRRPRPPRRLADLRGRLAEEKVEARPRGAELRRRRQREVDLQCVGKQEDAVDRRPRFEVYERYGVEFLAEPPRPVVEDVRDRDARGDREGQVEVGEAVARPDGKRSDGGARGDAFVFVREREDPRPERVSLLGGEQRPRR